jgi:GDP-L-fucose synthase
LKYGISSTSPIQPPSNAAAALHPTTVTLWGTGQVYREFMHVDDMAAACVKVLTEISIEEVMRVHDQKFTTFLNIGTGMDQTIGDIALLIRKIIGFEGELKFDHTKPDGTYRKLLDVSTLNALGFTPEYSLEAGINQVYKQYVTRQ